MMQPRILLVQAAALGYDLIPRFPELFQPLGLEFRPVQTVFPAVTCTVQATVRTGLPPSGHGIVCNGLFDRARARTGFWEQSARLLPPGRVWDGLRQRGGKVGVLFWQQSLGDDVDLVLSPAPIHKHEGGMIQDCYAEPAGLYEELQERLGQPFSLGRYWGPLASVKSTRWIVDATVAVLAGGRGWHAPELLLTYLPHLDYGLQKSGPQQEKKTRRAVTEFCAEFARLLAGARQHGYEVVVYGDYAMAPARQVVYPNRELCRVGLFQTRHVKRMTYPDLFASWAFAMVDHQVAHVFVRRAPGATAPDPVLLAKVRAVLAELPGVAKILTAAEFNHANAGDLVLVAAEDAWFAYPWWEEPHEAPDYATHVDIHSKIGFDPCELFFGWPPPAVSQDPTRVGGTHGRADLPVAFATTVPLPGFAGTLETLGPAVARLFG